MEASHASSPEHLRDDDEDKGNSEKPFTETKKTQNPCLNDDLKPIQWMEYQFEGLVNSVYELMDNVKVIITRLDALDERVKKLQESMEKNRKPPPEDTIQTQSKMTSVETNIRQHSNIKSPNVQESIFRSRGKEVMADDGNHGRGSKGRRHHSHSEVSHVILDPSDTDGDGPTDSDEDEGDMVNIANATNMGSHAKVNKGMTPGFVGGSSQTLPAKRKFCEDVPSSSTLHHTNKAPKVGVHAELQKSAMRVPNTLSSRGDNRQKPQSAMQSWNVAGRGKPDTGTTPHRRSIKGFTYVGTDKRMYQYKNPGSTLLKEIRCKFRPTQDMGLTPEEVQEKNKIGNTNPAVRYSSRLQHSCH
ncbi:hypothetical protein SESBI_11161 [Sesbania bispinosa]|nr:hypothetical protein SESBI_11161 [Sesbania bispinosa]